MIVRSGLIFGFVLWAAATALFVPLGHFVFGPDNVVPVPLSVGLSIAGTYASCYVFARLVFGRALSRSFESAALLGVCTCVPGLVLDGALIAFGGGRYPGLDATAAGTLSYGLLFAYAAALLGTIAAAYRPKVSAARSYTPSEARASRRTS